MARFTNFPNGITSLGMPVFGSGITLNGGGPVVQVGGPTGSTSSISGALTSLGSNTGGTIVVWPSATPYNANLTVANNNTTIIGLGPPNSVKILPTTAATTTTLTVTGQRCQFVNLDIIAGTGATQGTLVEGDECCFQNCKLETNDNVGIAIKWRSLGTSGQTGSIGKMIGCEVAWCASGIVLDNNLTGSPITEMMIDGCYLHNFTTAGIGEAQEFSCLVLTVQDCTFMDNEGAGTGAAPTAYISLATGGSNLNTGMVTRCSFPTALAGGLNTVSTGIKWVANYMTGGISTGQPS